MNIDARLNASTEVVLLADTRWRFVGWCSDIALEIKGSNGRLSLLFAACFQPSLPRFDFQ